MAEEYSLKYVCADNDCIDVSGSDASWVVEQFDRLMKKALRIDMNEKV